MVFADGSLGMSSDAMVALVGAGGVIAVLFKLLIAAKDEKMGLIVAERDRVIAELVAEKSTMAAFNKEALRFALEMINENRCRDGEPPIVVAPTPLPATLPAGTKNQLEHAELEGQLKTLAVLKDTAALRTAKQSGTLPEPGLPQN